MIGDTPIALVAGMGGLALMLVATMFYVGIYSIAHRGDTPEFPAGIFFIWAALCITSMLVGAVQIIFSSVP